MGTITPGSSPTEPSASPGLKPEQQKVPVAGAQSGSVSKAEQIVAKPETPFAGLKRQNAQAQLNVAASSDGIKNPTLENIKAKKRLGDRLSEWASSIKKNIRESIDWVHAKVSKSFAAKLAHKQMVKEANKGDAARFAEERRIKEANEDALFTKEPFSKEGVKPGPALFSEELLFEEKPQITKQERNEVAPLPAAFNDVATADLRAAAPVFQSKLVNGKITLVGDLGTKDCGIRSFETGSDIKGKAAVLEISKYGEKLDKGQKKVNDKREINKESYTTKDEGGKDVLDVKGYVEGMILEAMDQALRAKGFSEDDINKMPLEDKKASFADVDFIISATSWARNSKKKTGKDDPVIVELQRQATEIYTNMKVGVTPQADEAAMSASSAEFIYRHANVDGVNGDNILPIEAGGGSSQSKIMLPTQANELAGVWINKGLEEKGATLASVKENYKAELNKDMGDRRVPKDKYNIVCQGLMTGGLANLPIEDLGISKEEQVNWNGGMKRLPIDVVIGGLKKHIETLDARKKKIEQDINHWTENSQVNPEEAAKKLEDLKGQLKEVNEDINGKPPRGSAPQVAALAWLETLKERREDPNQELFVLNMKNPTSIEVNGEKLKMKASPSLGGAYIQALGSVAMPQA